MRSESQLNIQDARLVAEMTKPIGVEFKVKIVSVDKLTEITTRKVDGKVAPEFDTFIWGWGGDPYDPSLLLNLLTTKAIGASSDAFYSNPEYDRLYEQQSGEFDQAKRKELVEADDRAQPARPALHRADRRPDRCRPIAPTRSPTSSRSCPEPDGDITCDQVSYGAIAAMAPPSAAAGGGSGGDDGGSGLMIVLIVVAALIVIAVVVLIVRRRRAGQEAVELER